MFGYHNTAKLCLFEYLSAMLLHAVFAFFKVGTAAGIFVLSLTAVMVTLTFLLYVFVKNENIVISGLYLSVIISTTIVGASIGTLGFSVFIFLCLLCGTTIFMKEKQLLICMGMAAVAFVIHLVFFKDILLLTVSSIYMYLVYIICYGFASLGLYIIVKYAKLYMKGMNEKTEEAERANESKMLFLANMSHEIRTPMNAICGLSELNLREELSPVVRDNSEAIHSSGKILLAIVNDILDYSKMESGNMEIVPVTYSLSHLIEETASMMKIRLNDKDVDLKTSIADNIPDNLIGDEIRVRQILYNLLTNATKFTDNGYIFVDVTSEEIDDRNIRIIVSVQDSGIGIRKEDLNKLFTSFQQLDTHKSHAREGTGLGLAICKELVSMMNGSIHVESTYGVGTKFTFDIVQGISKKKEKLVYSETQTEGKHVEPKIQAPDAKVLVVDDNMVNLKVAKGLLRTFGLTVETCKSGRECLDILKDTKDFDLIFMDHMMPELDGIETLNLIRVDMNDYMQNVPVIALTANVMSGVREMFINEGFSDYVPKPIDVNWLNVVLRKYLPLEKQR